MRVLVCGGRDYSNTEFMYNFLDSYHKDIPIDVIIEGDAKGADRMAGYWARRNRVTNLKFKADWKKYGNRAGPVRNTIMLQEGKPDVVIAFPGGKGTEHMKTIARKAGIKVLEIEE